MEFLKPFLKISNQNENNASYRKKSGSYCVRHLIGHYELQGFVPYCFLQAIRSYRLNNPIKLTVLYSQNTNFKILNEDRKIVVHLPLNYYIEIFTNAEL